MRVLDETAQPDTVVRVEGGLIRGLSTADGEVRAFKGVAYARPPVGQLRWRPPQPVEPWQGIRRADSFGPRCVQEPGPIGSLGWFPPEPESEDCLYLNLWTAAKGPTERRPVMVWFHGGAFFQGSGSLPIFDGEGLARKQVVLVTVNYRLGRLGFLAHLDLSRESGHSASGNYGLMDQVAALQWLQANVAAFGGDPNRVTIFGQSAGSSSCCYLMAGALGKGLFHRCIGESAAGFNPTKKSTGVGGGLQTLSDAETSGAEFAHRLGAGSIDDLRSRSAYDVQLAPRGAGGFDTAYPVIDGYVLPAPVTSIFDRGAQYDVPLMTGSVAHESVEFGETLASYIAYAQAEFGDLAERFLQLYPADTDDIAREIAGYALGDRLFTWQNWTWARMHARNGASRVFHYRFTRVPPVPPGITFVENPRKTPRAFHTAEIPYIFRSFAARDWPWQQRDRELSDLVSAYWVNFALAGDPNGPGLPAWPAFDANAPTTMILGDDVHVGDVANRERLGFWQTYQERLQPGLAARP